MTHEYTLEAKALHKDFQDADKSVAVLKGVNFQVQAGETVAILGRSGSGKTTLLNLLGGLEKPTKGEVCLMKHSLSRLSEHKRGYLRNRVLGLIFQFHYLLPEFTALENVAMPLLIRGESLKRVREKSQDMLTKVGLEHRIQHKPKELSGGERQRVAIARALVVEPKCILADEPTGNLDTNSAQAVNDLMMELTEEIGTSLVVVTHDLDLAKKMSRVCLLQDGILVSVEDDDWSKVITA